MALLDKLQKFLDTLDEKTFYKYLGIASLGLFLVIGLIIFNYYRTTSYWHAKIETTNELREDIQLLLTKAQQIKTMQAEANRMLAEDEDFKIRGYFENLLNQLRIPAQNIVEINITPVDRDTKIRENILTAKLTDMNMKQLTELLEEIEQNKRVYIKEVEITKSKKRPNTIDISLTFATLNKITAT